MKSKPKPKYACPKCGETTLVTELDSYGIYKAEGDVIVYQKHKLDDNAVKLRCSKCWEDMPRDWWDGVAKGLDASSSAAFSEIGVDQPTEVKL